MRMQERLDTDKQTSQPQDKGPARAGKAATGQKRGRPKGKAHSAEKPDQPRESGATAAARLFGGAHKRKAEAQTEEGPAIRCPCQSFDPLRLAYNPCSSL